ncbi:hypothetical protein M0811_06978 [Anaeramoeba ignava]|uniref:Uncharacterized protein n=1 Tax=Anaeramoeba ignava TaxID=1746090 RepID=A0A9Q0LM97_ANAIG|nr:hypothetical protein M0811_06978 [Anaeramoeba ignava]|eukprot:Anaeramoba_ignava/c21709_g3_i1.p1 GENE.c21709_g3_i1~~c21709_g3_i1.p1  ORF type:complete len:1377 (+),score=580.99 c21709_g3_i1:26-4156(+)
MSKITDRERNRYVDFINKTLKEDPHVGDSLPINPDTMEIFDVIAEGVLLNKLILNYFPGVVDERKIVFKKKKSMFEKNINNEVCIKGAKAIGCTVVGIGGKDITDKKVTLTLGLVWQIIKFSLLARVKMKLAEQQDLQTSLGTDAKETPPDQILLRWFNHYLEKAGSKRKVKNFGEDLADGEGYLVILRQILTEGRDSLLAELESLEDNEENRERIEMIKNRLWELDQAKIMIEEALANPDHKKRAEVIEKVAEMLNCNDFVNANDITEANPRLGLAFSATLFNKASDRTVPDPSKQEIEKLKKEVAMLQQRVRKLHSGFLSHVTTETGFKTFEELKSEFIPPSIRFALLGENENENQKQFSISEQDPIDVLLRWINNSFEKAGNKRILTNTSEDIKDSEAYVVLFKSIFQEQEKQYSNFITKLEKKKEIESVPSLIKLMENKKQKIRELIQKNDTILKTTNQLERAKLVIEIAEQFMGSKCFIKPEDITQGSSELNASFIGSLFKQVMEESKFLRSQSKLLEEMKMKKNIEKLKTGVLDHSRNLVENLMSSFKKSLPFTPKKILPTKMFSLNKLLNPQEMENLPQEQRKLMQNSLIDENEFDFSFIRRDGEKIDPVKSVIQWINSQSEKRGFDSIKEISDLKDGKIYAFILSDILSKETEYLQIQKDMIEQKMIKEREEADQQELTGNQETEKQKEDESEKQLVLIQEMEEKIEEMEKLKEKISTILSLSKEKTTIEPQQRKQNAGLIVEISNYLNIAPFIDPTDIAKGDQEINILFSTSLMKRTFDNQRLASLIKSNIELSERLVQLEERIKKVSETRAQSAKNRIENNIEVQKKRKELQKKQQEVQKKQKERLKLLEQKKKLRQKKKHQFSPDSSQSIEEDQKESQTEKSGDTENDQNEDNKIEKDDLEKEFEHENALEWMNYHLQKQGINRKLQSYEDLSDGVGYAAAFVGILGKKKERIKYEIEKIKARIKLQELDPKKIPEELKLTKEEIEEYQQRAKELEKQLDSVQEKIDFTINLVNDPDKPDFDLNQNLENLSDSERNEFLKKKEEFLAGKKQKRIDGLSQISEFLGINNLISTTELQSGDNTLNMEISNELFQETKQKELDEEKNQLIEELQEKIAFLTQENTELQTEVDSLTEALENLVEEKDTLETEYEEYQKNKEDEIDLLNQKHREELEKQIQTSVREIQEIKSELGKSEGEKGQLVQRLTEIENRSKQEAERLTKENVEALTTAESRKKLELAKLRELMKRDQKDGWLYHFQTTLFKKTKWKRKWFMLRDNVLSSFKTPDSLNKPDEMFLVSEIRVYKNADKDLKRKHVFQIRVNEIDYYLAASSEEEMKEWVHALTTARRVQDQVQLLSNGTTEILETKK